MRIDVRLFAMHRVQVGRRSLVLELPEGADVAAAWRALVTSFPALGPSADSVRFARNGRYVDPDEPLARDDELAVIPPVAGGDEAGSRLRRIEVRDDPIDDALLGELRRQVATSADGAVVLFVGQTRDSPGTPAPGQEDEAARFVGQRVEGLEL